MGACLSFPPSSPLPRRTACANLPLGRLACLDAIEVELLAAGLLRAKGRAMPRARGATACA